MDKFEDITLSEISQLPKGQYCKRLLLREVSIVVKLTATERRPGDAGSVGEGEGRGGNGQPFSGCRVLIL